MRKHSYSGVRAVPGECRVLGNDHVLAPQEDGAGMEAVSVSVL